MSLGPVFVYALLGGMLPALLWLWFFLREDAQRPEPRWLIVAAFLSGMLAVLLALPVEMLIKCYAAGTWPPGGWFSIQEALSYCANLKGPDPVYLWAAAEELLKYLVAVSIILWRRAVDEPIDAMIYLLTVALGFAALETGLYLMKPFGDGNIALGIIMGDMRFMGAALLHTIASATVGFFIALTFYRHHVLQFLSLCTGLVLAIVLHALFNHHIMTASTEQKTQLVFFLVWIGVVALFLLFERAKRIRRPITS